MPVIIVFDISSFVQAIHPLVHPQFSLGLAPKFTFPSNGLTITNIDIQSVEPVDQKTRAHAPGRPVRPYGVINFVNATNFPVEKNLFLDSFPPAFQDWLSYNCWKCLVLVFESFNPNIRLK